MFQWAANSTYYHIMIDRFATGKNQFCFQKSPRYASELKHWMGGSLHGITQSLDYLQELGIGVILLTPFFKNKKYHGYWTIDFQQIDPHFGNLQHLKQLINSAHQRDMRIIMDFPLTHCHIDAYPAKQAFTHKNRYYRNWFYCDSRGKHKGFYGNSNLPELNLEFSDTSEFLKKTIAQWLELEIDGIRFDHAKRPSTFFWRNFTDFLRKQYPQVYLLGENWHESEMVGTLSNYLHGELNIPVSNALRAFINNPNKRNITQVVRHTLEQQTHLQNNYLLPTFIDNHDIERASHLANNNQAIIALGYLLQLTLPYPPIVYYGSERAQAQSANFPRGRYERDRFFREPMDWCSGSDMATWLKTLITFRNKHIESFRIDTMDILSLDDDTFMYSYSNKQSMIIIAINHSTHLKEIALPDCYIEELITHNAGINHKNHDKTNLVLEGYGGAVLKCGLCN